jgi:hypothetical protein
MTPGHYWLALHVKSAQTTNGVAGVSNNVLAMRTQIAQNSNLQLFGVFGAVSNSTVQMYPFLGIISAAGSITTSNIHATSVLTTASHVLPVLQIHLENR